LDFGIYRILNFRRREINKFIEERLPQRVNEAFAHFAAHTEEEINRRMAELRRKIREAGIQEHATGPGIRTT